MQTFSIQQLRRWFGCTLALAVTSCTIAGCTINVQTDLDTGNSTPNDEAQIAQLYADWRTAVRTADIDAYVSYLHPQVRMLPPGTAAVVSAEAYREFLGPVFAAATYDIEVERMPQIDVVGDIAVAEYDYTIVLNLKDSDVGVAEPGALTANRTTSRYFDVLRKNTDGRWQVWKHSWQVYPSPAP